MKFNIYSIYDVKAGAYVRPIYMRSDEEMMASVFETAKDQNSGFYKHPDDYTVFLLGTFDEENAEIDFHGPKSISTVLDIRAYMQRKHLSAMRRLKMEAELDETSVLPTGKKDENEFDGLLKIEE